MEFERIFGLLDVTADFRTCVPRWKQLLKINRLGTDQWKLRRLFYCKREFDAEDEREFPLLESTSMPDLPTAKICVKHLLRAKAATGEYKYSTARVWLQGSSASQVRENKE